MEPAEQQQQQEKRDGHPAPRGLICCVYWCRDLGVINVEMDGRQYTCCRKHAPFVKAGKIDWFDR